MNSEPDPPNLAKMQDALDPLLTGLGYSRESVAPQRRDIALAYRNSIPMNGAVRAVLEPIRGEGAPAGPVFGKAITLLAQTRRDFNKMRVAAKLEGLRFHDLRHTFATRLVTRGVDIVTVSKLLGHSTIVMTMRYSHPAPEDLRRAVGKLEAPEELVKLVRRKHLS